MRKRIGKNKSNIGILGEDIALKWLISKGFSLVAQNFKTYHGEIDIIVDKGSKTYFVEIKSVDISHGTLGNIDPRDNFTLAKSQKMEKAVEFYLMNHPKIKSFQTMLLCIYINQTIKEAKVRCLENPILN